MPRVRWTPRNGNCGSGTGYTRPRTRCDRDGTSSRYSPRNAITRRPPAPSGPLIARATSSACRPAHVTTRWASIGPLVVSTTSPDAVSEPETHRASEADRRAGLLDLGRERAAHVGVVDDARCRARAARRRRRRAARSRAGARRRASRCARRWPRSAVRARRGARRSASSTRDDDLAADRVVDAVLPAVLAPSRCGRPCRAAPCRSPAGSRRPRGSRRSCGRSGARRPPPPSRRRRPIGPGCARRIARAVASPTIPPPTTSTSARSIRRTLFGCVRRDLDPEASSPRVVACGRATRRALLLPDLRGRVRHRRDGRRRPGRAGARRRRPSGVPRATCAPRAAGSRRGITRPRRLDHPRLRGRDVTWDELLADLAGRLDAIIDDGRARRGRALPRNRSRVRRGRADRGEPVAPVDREPLVPHRGHGRQRAGARRGRARERRADAEPGVGSDRGPGWRSSSARIRSSRTATAPRSRIRSATSASTAARGGRVWVLDPRRTETAARGRRARTRPARRRRRRARRRWPTRCSNDGADERELREHCDADEVAALRAALARVHDRAGRGRGRRRSRAARRSSSPTCARTAGRVAMHCGTGVTMARDGVLAEWLRWVILIASGSLDRAAGMHFHRGVVQPAAPAQAAAAHRGPPAAREPARAAPRASGRSRRSRSSTRSRPATSARCSSPAGIR